MKQGNPKSRWLLATWIGVEVLVAGWIGWEIANAKQTKWAIQPKARIPGPRTRR